MKQFENFDLIPLIVFVAAAENGRVLYANPVAERKGIIRGTDVFRMMQDRPSMDFDEETSHISAVLLIESRTYKAECYVSKLDDDGVAALLFTITSLQPSRRQNENDVIAQICDVYIDTKAKPREFLRMTAQAVGAFNAVLYEKRNGRYIICDEWRDRKSVCIPMLSTDFDINPDGEAARLKTLKRAKDAAYASYVKPYGTQGVVIYLFDESVDVTLRAHIKRYAAVYKTLTPDSSHNDFISVIKKAMDTVGQGFAIWDSESRTMLYENRVFRDVFGPDSDVMLKGQPEDCTGARSGFVYTDVSGRVFNVTHLPARVGRRGILVTAVVDITKYKLAEKRLEMLAKTDALTGLQNRRAGLELLEQIYAQSKKEKHPLTVCFADIDGLKRINDSFGHDVGDNMIRMVAGMLKKHVGEAGSVCRLGGDEFVLILPGYGKAQAMMLSSKIGYAVDKCFIDKSQSITLSFGFKEADYSDEETSATLINVADFDMYREKHKKA